MLSKDNNKQKPTVSQTQPVEDVVEKNKTATRTSEERMEELVARKLQELEHVKRDLEARAKALYHETQEFNPLISKIITIKPVQLGPTSVIKDASEATMLTGTKRTYGAQVDSRGRIINPLTRDEQLFFEKLLNKNLSTDLEIDKNFWVSKSAKLQVFKTNRSIESATVRLDLSRPYDYILWKIALAHDKIANSINDLNLNPMFELVIVDEEEITAKEVESGEKEDFVIEFLLTHKNNRKILMDTLRLYGVSGLNKTVTLDTPIEHLYLAIKKVSKTKIGIEKLYDVINLTPSVSALKVLIEDAISMGLIEVRGNEYTLKGGQVIGYTKEAVEVFLNDRANQTVKLQLQESVNNYLKKLKQ